MKKHDDLIAVLLGDARSSPALERWLDTDEGRREREAYRRALDGLGRLYGEVTTGPARRPVYYCSLPTPIGPLLRQPTLNSHVRGRATGAGSRDGSTPSLHPPNHAPEEHGSIPRRMAPCLRPFSNT